MQAALWLVPLVALCGVRWRDHLVWAGAEALHFAMVWVYVGGLSKADRGLPARLVRRVRRCCASPPSSTWPGGSGTPRPCGRRTSRRSASGPARSPTRTRDAVVDELAGPFTDAPDRLIVRLG